MVAPRHRACRVYLQVVFCITLLIQQAILQDLFPGVQIPDHDYGKLQSAIEESLVAKGLQVST